MTVEFRMSGATVTELRVKLLSDPHLQAALKEVARRTNLTEGRIREHFDGLLLTTLDVLGLEYVQDIEAAKANVRRLRARVHEAYELLFERRLTDADVPALADLVKELEGEARAIADPQQWAKDQAARQRHPAQPARATAQDLARHQRASRVRGLTEERRTAFEFAQGVAPDRVEAALRGERKALAALPRELSAGGMNDWAVGRAMEAIADIRDPGPDYAFGAGISGLRTGPVEVRAAFGDLPTAQRDMVNRAIIADPDFVRAAVIAEGIDTAAARREFDLFCTAQGITAEQRATLEAGLRTLNEAHQESQHTIRPGGIGSLQARARAATIDRTAASMGLPTRDEVARRLVRSSAVVEMANRSPGHLRQFVDNWLRYAVEQQREHKPVATLERYVRALSRSHVRGLLGELTAVFQLSDEAWVIKVPDLAVTVGGTDFVLVSKTTGEVLYGDNKALSSRGLGEVTSLMENFDDNMEADNVAFGKLPGREDIPLPPKVSDAIGRAAKASAEVKAFIRTAAAGQPVTDEFLISDAVQQGITDILRKNDIRRIVTNAGSENLAWLTESLRKYIDFANLNEPGPYLPRSGPTAPEPAGGSENTSSPEGSVP